MGFVGWPLDFELCTLDSGLWFLEFRSRFSQKPKVLGLWALEFVFWILKLGLWILESGLWTLDFPPCALAFRLWYSSLWALCFGWRTLNLGLWAFDFALGVLDFLILEFGLWMVDFGCWALDFELWALDFEFRLLYSN